MSDQLASTDRPMFCCQIIRDRLGMDEPTIDCWCSEHADYDADLQVLDDDARWVSILCVGRCQTHLPLIAESMCESLGAASRVVISRR